MKTSFLTHTHIPFEFCTICMGSLWEKKMYFKRPNDMRGRREGRRRRPFLPLGGTWPSGTAQEYLNKCCTGNERREKDKEFTPTHPLP